MIKRDQINVFCQYFFKYKLGEMLQYNQTVREYQDLFSSEDEFHLRD